MNIVQRAKNIVLNPKATWQEIEQERSSPAVLYTQYYMILALIPAIATFIGLSIVGMSFMGVSVRVPVITGIINLIVSYVLSLVGVYILSLVINFFAPKFGGLANPLNALKVAVYASTASLLGGIFGLIPFLGILGLLAALYSIYLLYLGLPVLMKNPPDKSAAYTAVVFVVALVLMLVFAGISSLLLPRRGLDAASITMNTPSGQVTVTDKNADGTVSIHTPGGSVTMNPKAMEEAAKRMEQAKTPADVGAALSAAAGQSSQPVEAYPADTLKALLPSSLDGLNRQEISASKQAAMGMSVSEASARYSNDQQSIRLKIQDLGPAGTMAQAYAGAVEGSSETDTHIEKHGREGDRVVMQRYEKDGSNASYKLILKNGVIVEADGNVSIEQLKNLVNGLNLASLETAPRPKKA